MKKFILFIMVALFVVIPVDVFAGSIQLCKYTGYKSNQDTDGTITISVDPDTGKWTVSSDKNSSSSDNWLQSMSGAFLQTDTFDRVFSTAGVAKDIAITTEDYNALKTSGTCPSSAIRTNVGSYNIYFGAEATNIINAHTIKLGSAKAAGVSYNWQTNATSAEKEALENYFTNGVQTITDGSVSWVKKCNYDYTKNEISGNVSIYFDEVNSKWRVVADKGQGKSQFDKEGTFDYVFSTQSSKDVMISTADKTKLKSGACPDGALFNTGSEKNDVYIGEMARELSDKKDSVEVNETAATDNFMTEAQYVEANGSDNYKVVYDDDAHIGDHFCSQPQVMNAMRVLGYFIFVAKILIPLIIIGFSVFDMYHGVLGGDEKSLKESARKLGIRTLIGFSVFLLPSILNVILMATNSYEEISSDSYICQVCLLKPQECENGVPSDTNLYDNDIFVTGEKGEADDSDSSEASNDEVEEEIIVE